MSKIRVVINNDGYFVSEVLSDSVPSIEVEYDITVSGVLTDKHRLINGVFVFQANTEHDYLNQLALIRVERDKRLSSSDWTQLPDVPLQTKELWAIYRQALRDITQQPDPFNITWPEPPSN